GGVENPSICLRRRPAQRAAQGVDRHARWSQQEAPLQGVAVGVAANGVVAVRLPEQRKPGRVGSDLRGTVGQHRLDGDRENLHPPAPPGRSPAWAATAALPSGLAWGVQLTIPPAVMVMPAGAVSSWKCSGSPSGSVAWAM